MVEPEVVETSTFCLQSRRTTAVLRPRYWNRQESNLCLLRAREMCCHYHYDPKYHRWLRIVKRRRWGDRVSSVLWLQARESNPDFAVNSRARYRYNSLEC